jgi:hypothetical protein
MDLWRRELDGTAEAAARVDKEISRLRDDIVEIALAASRQDQSTHRVDDATHEEGASESTHRSAISHPAGALECADRPTTDVDGSRTRTLSPSADDLAAPAARPRATYRPDCST